MQWFWTDDQIHRDPYHGWWDRDLLSPGTNAEAYGLGRLDYRTSLINMERQTSGYWHEQGAGTNSSRQSNESCGYKVVCGRGLFYRPCLRPSLLAAVWCLTTARAEFRIARGPSSFSHWDLRLREHCGSEFPVCQDRPLHCEGCMLLAVGFKLEGTAPAGRRGDCVQSKIEQRLRRWR